MKELLCSVCGFPGIYIRTDPGADTEIRCALCDSTWDDNGMPLTMRGINVNA